MKNGISFLRKNKEENGLQNTIPTDFPCQCPMECFNWISVTGEGGLGDDCENNADCNGNSNLHCEDGICKCADDYEFNVETLTCGQLIFILFIPSQLETEKTSHSNFPLNFLDSEGYVY